MVKVTITGNKSQGKNTAAIKILEQLKEDIPGRVKVTTFIDGSYVSTINNTERQKLEPFALIRNQIFGAFPFETFYRKDIENRGVIAHYNTQSKALKGHNKFVKKILNNNFDFIKVKKLALKKLKNKEVGGITK